MNHRASPWAQTHKSVSTEAVPWAARELYIGRICFFEKLSWLIQAYLSLLGLILFSPLLLLIAIFIKLTSSGPVFYSGDRVGVGKQLFRIYKFRTLIVGAEQKIGGRLLTSKDKNVHYTPLGRFLKRSKLDELPQLFNVIRGEMRLVGPRPSRPIFLEQSEQEISNYAFRFVVPPGITGIAQLRGGYYTSPRNKLRYDMIYIKNRSLLFDIQLILLTFVKILNRWLSMGFFILFLFLFVSLVPSDLQPLFSVSFHGLNFNLIYLFIIVVATWVFLRTKPAEFCFYRSPLNQSILLFILLGFLAAFVSPDPYSVLQGSGYYVVSGFLVALVIVNSLATMEFITLMVRAIALTSVLLSSVGLFGIFILNNANASGVAANLVDNGRLASLLGNPVTLSVYLVLGIPLLMCEMIRARSQKEHDFWLVCTTISFVGIFFTQTRVGLLALLVTGTIFLCKRLRNALSFAAIFFLCVLVLISIGLPRFSLPEIRADVGESIEEKMPIITNVSLKQWLIGAGSLMGFENQTEDDPDKTDTSKNQKVPNMHVTLIMEHGVVGWLIMMWLIFSSLRSMKRVYSRIADERLKTVLWAIISCLSGFLVSMNAMNTFHNLTIQIFFWSLIGIGLAIVIKLNGERRHNIVWRFGDAGD